MIYDEKINQWRKKNRVCNCTIIRW